MKLYDSELKVLEVLWHEDNITAKRVAEILRDLQGWSKTTSYTVIKKCVDKGVIRRQEPNFVCHVMLSREQAQQKETTELINKMYGGMSDQLVASILGSKDLSKEEIDKLKRLVLSLE